MEGHSIIQPVHVAVQMATVGIPVEVSALYGHCQMMNVVVQSMMPEPTAWTNNIWI